MVRAVKYPRVTVPHHKTVAPGIVRQIMNVVPNAPEKWR